jgi:hypothetical protein
MGSWERGNEHSGPIKRKGFIDHCSVKLKEACRPSNNDAERQVFQEDGAPFQGHS